LFNKPIYKWEDLGQVQSSDRQRNIIYYLVHHGKGRTEAARLAGFAAPRQSAFTLTQSPNIIIKIRQERNKVYQTELASTSVHTLKEVMEDTDAPASARIAATRTSLELAGDIGKQSQSQRNYEQNLAEMTPEELSAIIDKWEGEKAAIAKDITPV
jgi:hypothetical protein